LGGSGAGGGLGEVVLVAGGDEVAEDGVGFQGLAFEFGVETRGGWGSPDGIGATGLMWPILVGKMDMHSVVFRQSENRFLNASFTGLSD
jgi:hypothetical protein